MRRYIITCEFYKTKRTNEFSDCVRRLASEWQHPLASVWIVKTSMNAGEIREALLVHLGFQDRLYICEAGSDAADFNTVQSSGGKITQIGEVRFKNRMLASIFGRDGSSSRHLKAATAKSLKSA
jgi:hypothetical protein